MLNAFDGTSTVLELLSISLTSSILIRLNGIVSSICQKFSPRGDAHRILIVSARWSELNETCLLYATFVHLYEAVPGDHRLLSAKPIQAAIVQIDHEVPTIGPNNSNCAGYHFYYYN